MTDLTKITTPFGLLDPETQKALRDWPHGVEVWCGGMWQIIQSSPVNPDFTYRARPAPLTKPSIDWSHIAPEWKWLAVDGDGKAAIYTHEPYKGKTMWDYPGYGSCIYVGGLFASYTPGTCDWTESLVQRPEVAR